MNKAQREVAEYLLDKEERIIKQLERQYKQALSDVEMDIRIMLMDEQTPSRIHRVEYQKRLKSQIEATLENLHRNEYKTINQFLQDSYTDAFVGAMYDMHSQGVPVIVPIDQNAAVKAIQLDTQLSDRKIHPNANGEHVTLYESLGVDVDNLKETIRLEITRGLATNMQPEYIAQNIANLTKAPLSRAKTIARTESHRIQQSSAQDARERAKARGADVYKQWDSTLDGATRKAHRELDGQIVPINKPFTYGNLKAMYPGDFGDPAQDCNCRCVAVQRARWALDEEELQTMKERAEFFGLGEDKAKKQQFAEFEKKYLGAARTVEKSGKSGIIELEEDPYYEGLSKEDIASRYKKSDGSNLLDDDFLNIPIAIQREAVRGYDKAITLYGDVPPQRIKVGKLNSGVFALYNNTFKTITMNPVANAVRGEAYATVIHEMTHHAGNIKLFDSADVLRGALQKLGLRSNAKQAEVLKMRTVGSLKKSDWNNADEIVAYAIERQLTGRQNDLTEAIYATMKEKGVIK